MAQVVSIDADLKTIPQGRQVEHWRREWSGVVVDGEAWKFKPEPVLHPFPNESQMLLVTLLDQEGGTASPRLAQNRPYPIENELQSVHFVCAGMPFWGYSERITFVRDLKLLFSEHAVERILGDQLDRPRLQIPVLCHQDQRLFTLLKLLGDAARSEDSVSGLYGDGLICSAVALLFAKASGASSLAPTRLAPWQLRRAIEFMQSQLPRRIEIAELANLINVSPAHFSRAFRASVGVAPYQWQLRTRVERAQNLLRGSRLSVEEVAVMCGFVDGAHFTRVFRRILRTSPGVWRKSAQPSHLEASLPTR